MKTSGSTQEPQGLFSNALALSLAATWPPPLRIPLFPPKLSGSTYYLTSRPESTASVELFKDAGAPFASNVLSNALGNETPPDLLLVCNQQLA